MKKEMFRSLALKAAVAGLFAGAALVPGCGSETNKSEQNGCGGPNGCGGENGCSGPNGCNGHGTKGVEEKNQ